jgi:hypothetical protein
MSLWRCVKLGLETRSQLCPPIDKRLSRLVTSKLTREEIDVSVSTSGWDRAPAQRGS